MHMTSCKDHFQLCEYYLHSDADPFLVMFTKIQKRKQWKE